jgi:hypothetical protein
MRNSPQFIIASTLALLAASCASRPSQTVPSTNVTASDATTVHVIDYELRMRPAKVGDKRTVTFELDPTDVQSAAVQVTGFDIDGVTETEMYINDHKIPLPPEIVADMRPKTVTVEFDQHILKEGKNSLSFLFADAVGGTTGFSITDVKISLLTSDFNTIDVIKSELKLKPAKVGDKATVPFFLQLKDTKSTAVQVTGFDIDGSAEAEMYINDRKIPLPPEIVADMMPKTVTIELDKRILREGENQITFLFAEAVGGTNGYSIPDAKILLRK